MRSEVGCDRWMGSTSASLSPVPAQPTDKGERGRKDGSLLALLCRGPATATATAAGCSAVLCRAVPLRHVNRRCPRELVTPLRWLPLTKSGCPSLGSMGACSVEPKWEEGRKKQNQLNYPRKKNLPGACSAELMIARHNSIPPACPSSSPLPAFTYVHPWLSSGCPSCILKFGGL